MVTSSILSPSDCTPDALADFESLVIEAGTVDPHGLKQRIRNASRLLFLRESNGQLVGVGGLKHPLLSYRSKVFAKARATASSDEYRNELGWVAVAKAYQGRGLSRRIIGELIGLAEDENLFATARANARAMRFAADYGFRPAGKPYPSGRGYDLVLYLRDAPKDKRREADLESKKTQHR
jgi:GNAT superfamily N-acetyltransferase